MLMNNSGLEFISIVFGKSDQILTEFSLFPFLFQFSTQQKEAAFIEQRRPLPFISQSDNRIRVQYESH